jgi:hypothetical protein
MNRRNIRENYCGLPHKKTEDIVEGYGGRPQGCAYSTGDYNVMGNAALCEKQFIGNMPASYVHNAMIPSVKEDFCKSCIGNSNKVPVSYRKEMMKGNIKEPFGHGCNGGDYNVFNYDMVEGFSNNQLTNAGYLGNMNFPPALTLIPHQFVNNMKLSIEDPDNRWTYWLGGSPCPCKSGPNQSSPRRSWLGVTNQ